MFVLQENKATELFTMDDDRTIAINYLQRRCDSTEHSRPTRCNAEFSALKPTFNHYIKQLNRTLHCMTFSLICFGFLLPFLLFSIFVIVIVNENFTVYSYSQYDS